MVNANGMSMKARVILIRNINHDQRALTTMERPRMVRRASIWTPIPIPPPSTPPNLSRSAPNTPKTIKSILKGSKSKPFTLVGRRRSSNSILKYLVPRTSTSVSSPQPSTSVSSPLPSTSGLAISLPTAIPVPDQSHHESTNINAPVSNDDDEFVLDIVALNDNDDLYVTDEEDI